MNTPKQIPAAPRPYLRVATPLMAAALGALSACGGGGGSSPAPSPAPTPAAVDCVAKVETVGACQFSIPAIKSGLSLLVATSSMGYKGSVTATCGTTGVLDVKTSSSCTEDRSALALQTSVPTPTYVPGSAAATAFEMLNRNRLSCGFGLLSQSLLLDKSATNHGNYIAALDTAGLTAYMANPHTEVASNAGFTGVTVFDRIKAAGYVTTGQIFDASESLTPATYGIDNGQFTISETGQGLLGVRAQLTSILHMSVLMGSYREVGLGTPRTKSIAYPGTVFAPLVVDPAYVGNAQYSGELTSFPCEGVTEVSGTFNGESPDPLAGTGLKYPVGTPIMFAAGASTTAANQPTVTVKTATVAPTSGSGAQFSTADGSLFVYTQRANRQFLVPTKPLADSTSYKVTATVTVNGVDAVRTFTFKTDEGAGLAAKYFNGTVPQ